MSPNPYLQKLHALRATKDTPPEATKLTKPRNGGFEGTKVGSVSFVSTQGVGFFDPQARNKSMLQEAKNTPSEQRQNQQNAYGRALAALQARCPDVVSAARWQLAVDDGRRFLARWGERAEALGWTARDLFGLRTPPAKPHPSYSRLSRYDETGLIWLLQGRPVVAITEATAAIQRSTGAVTVYRRHNKPAFGPLGDSLNDFDPPTAA
jgi:hypothetical protein